MVEGVVRGEVAIEQAGAVTTIQAGRDSIINYHSFSIGAGETVQFIQPDEMARVLNRVTAADQPSIILGQLLANGQVFLVNPAGITFGRDAVIDVGSLYAAAGTISNEDFLAGLNRFGGLEGEILNEGTIRAGEVGLFGRSVINAGSILVPDGLVALATGGETYVGQRDSGVYVKVEPGAAAADGGGGFLSGGDIYSLAIRDSGLIRARQVVADAGPDGALLVEGRIEADRHSTGADGGIVALLGNHVALAGDAVVDASGDGGTIHVGGGVGGADPELRNAEALFAGPGVTLRADGLGGGSGGEVVLWSEEATRFYGTITARGGETGGDGGFVEVSSRGFLDYRGFTDTRAPFGNTGLLLLDPRNIRISTQASDEIGAAPNFQSTGTDSVLNVGDLLLALTASDVTVTTGSGTAAPGNITVENTIDFTGIGTTRSLTFNAHNNIVFQAGTGLTSAGNPADILNLSLNANNAAGGGSPSGSGVVTIDAPIDLNGGAFAATGTGFASTAAITADSVSVSVSGPISAGALDLADTLALTAAGTISQTAPWEVGGASTFTVTAAGSDLLLGQDNDLAAITLVESGAGTFRDVVLRNLAATAAVPVLPAASLRDLTLQFPNAALEVPAITLNAGGSLSVTAGGAITQAAGGVTIPGSASFTTGAFAITLDDADNSFGGSVALTNAGANTVEVVQDGALDLAASSVGGDLDLTAELLTQSGVLTVGGDLLFTPSAADADLLLGGFANAIAGAVTIQGTLANLRDLSLRNTGGAAVPGLAGLTSLRNLSLEFPNTGITLPAVTLAAGGNLTLAAGGAITGAGATVVPGATSLTTGATNFPISFTDPGNAFSGAVSLGTQGSGGSVSLLNSGVLDLGNGTIGGGLTVTGAGITQSGVLVIGGATSITSDTAAIVLDNTSNTFNGPVAIQATGGANAEVRTRGNPLSLAASTITGDLVLEGLGMTQTDAVTVGGTTTLELFGASRDILWHTQDNDFTGALSVVNPGNLRDFRLRNVNTLASPPSLAGAASLRDLTLDFPNAPLALPTATMTGNLAATAGGSITQAAGGLNVGGTATVTTGAFGITLDDPGNVFTGAVSLTNTGANNATLVNTAPLVLAATSIGGDLSATGNGISQNAAFTIGGGASFTGGTGAISLGLAANTIAGTVDLSTTNNATLQVAGSLDFGTVAVGGTLGATGVGITQAAPLNVGGAATLSSGAGDLLLGLANTFGSTVSLATSGGADAELGSAGGLNLAVSNVSGSLLLAGSGFNQTGVLTVGNGLTFSPTAVDADVLFGVQANAVTGPVGLTGTQANLRDFRLRNQVAAAAAPDLTGAVNLRDLRLHFPNASLALPGYTLSGDLDIEVGGTISQTGALSAGGTAAFQTGSAAINLADPGNAFTGAVTLVNTGTNAVTVVNSLPLQFGTVSAGGNLTASGDGITQLAALTVGGASAFGGGAGSVVLGNPANSFGGPVGVQTSGAGNATLGANAAIDLAASTVGGSLAVDAPGIGQSGPLDIGGNASFDAGANPITLTDAANAFGAGVALFTTGANAASITAGGALTFTASQVGGTLTATAPGIGQTGILTLGGGGSLDAGVGVVDLPLANVFGGPLQLTSASAGLSTLASAGSLTLAAANIAGDLLLDFDGLLDQTGILDIGNLLRFAATAPSDIELHSHANLVAGGLDFSLSPAAFRDVRLRFAAPAPSLAGLAGLAGLRTLELRLDAEPITLPALTLTGDLLLTAHGPIAAPDPVAVAGDVTLETTLADAGISFDQLAAGGEVAVQTSGPLADVLLRGSGGMTLAASTIGGGLLVDLATGSLDNTGSLAVGADADFRTQQAGAAITLNDLDVGGVVELHTAAGGDATIAATGPLVLGGGAIGGDLALTVAGGSLTDAATLAVGGTAAFATTTPGSTIDLDQVRVAGAIGLDTAGPGGDARLVNLNAGGTTLGAVRIRGDLEVTAASGDLAGPAAIEVDGAAAFATQSAGGAIDLSNVLAGGPLHLATNGAAADATLVSPGPVLLGTVDLGGRLAVTAITGGIQAPATVRAAGDARFTSSQAGAQVVVDALEIGGGLELFTSGPGGDATIRSLTALSLGAGTVEGDLTVTIEQGNLTDMGSMQVQGLTRLETEEVDATIDLDQAVFGGGVELHTAGASGNVSLIHGTALELLGGSIGGGLDVRLLGGDLTDSGVLTVAGPSRFETSAIDAVVTLDQIALGGPVLLFTHGAAGHATLANAGALELAGGAVGGDLSATATGGSLTDSGPLAVDGEGRFTAVGGNVGLAFLDVAGPIEVTALSPGATANLVNASAVDLAAAGVAGRLSVHALAGSLTDSGAVTAGDGAVFQTSAPGAVIDLDQLNITGPVTLFTAGSAGHATLVNAGALELAGGLVEGDLSATALSGNLTGGGFAVTGAGRFETMAAGAQVDLGPVDIGGRISGATSGSTGSYSIVNHGNTLLGNLAVGGTLSVESTAGSIRDDATVQAAGGAVFRTLQADETIELDSLDVAGALSVFTVGAGGDATLRNASAGGTVLGAGHVGGGFDLVVVNGGLTDAATLRVDGSTRLELINGTVTANLDQVDLRGPVSLFAAGAGNDFTLVNAGTLGFDTVFVGRDLVAAALAGDLLASGLLNIGRDATLAALAPGREIDAATVVVGGILNLTTAAGGDARILSGADLELGSVDVGGDFGLVLQSGSLTGTAPVQVAGMTALAAQAPGASLRLDQLDSVGPVIVQTSGVGADVRLAGPAGMELGAASVGGHLSVEVFGGDLVADTGRIESVDGVDLFNRHSGGIIRAEEIETGGPIRIETTGPAGHARLINHFSGGTDLAAAEVAGDLEVDSPGGLLVAAGPVRVTGEATFRAPGGGGLDLAALEVAGLLHLETGGPAGDAIVRNLVSTLLGDVSIAGRLELTGAAGGISGGRPVVVAEDLHLRAEAGGSVDLSDLSVGGSLSFETVGGGSVDLRHAGDLLLGASTVSGDLDLVVDGGGLSGPDPLTVAGDVRLELTDADHAISLQALDAGGSLALHTSGGGGDASIRTPGSLLLDAATVGGALRLEIGGASLANQAALHVGGLTRIEFLIPGASLNLTAADLAGPFSLAASGPGFTGILDSPGTLDLGQISAGGDFNITAADGISSSGPVEVDGILALTTGAAGAGIDLATLESAGRLDLTIAAGGDATIDSAQRLVFGPGQIGGDLTALARTGGMESTGSLTVAGDLDFEARGGGFGIEITDTTVGGVIRLSTQGPSGHVSIVGPDTVALGAGNIGGDLFVRSTAGAISTVAALAVSGDAIFEAPAAAGQVDLQHLGVGGSLGGLSGADFSILHQGALTLDTLSAGGVLAIEAVNGGIVGPGRVEAGGDLRLTTSGTGGAVTLADASSGGQLTLQTGGTGGHATLVFDGPVVFAASSVGGNLDLTANGGVGNAAPVRVEGTSRIETTPSGAGIDLEDFLATGGAGFFTSGPGGDVRLVNPATQALVTTSTIGGALHVEADGIHLSGTIETAGDQSYLFGASGRLSLPEALVATGGDLRFNALDTRGDNPFRGSLDIPFEATIFSLDPSRAVLLRGNHVVMGRNEKLSIGGAAVDGLSLRVEAATDAVFGDLNAHGRIEVEAGSEIVFIGRPPAPVRQADGTLGEDDGGTDIVARDLILNRPITLFNPPDLAALPQSFIFAGTDGALANETVRNDPRISLRAQISFPANWEVAGPGGGTFVLDLIAEGAAPDNISEAIAAATPTTQIAVPVQTDISEALREELARIGIYARPNEFNEVFQGLLGHVTFLQIITREQARPSDYLVAAGRIAEDAVRSALEVYYRLFWERDADGTLRRSLVNEVSQALADAHEAFLDQEAEFDPAAFRAWVEAAPGDSVRAEAARILGDFQLLFDRIAFIGLTPKEIEISQNELLRSIRVPGLTARMLLETIQAGRPSLAMAEAEKSRPTFFGVDRRRTNP